MKSCMATKRVLAVLGSAAGLALAAGTASAAGVTLLNGTTTTAVNGSGSYGTTWTAPVITTGAGDKAFGADGYLMYATSAAGTASGSYDYNGDPNYAGALDPMSLTNVTGYPNGVVTNTLLKVPSYLTISDTAMNNQWDSGFGYSAIYARDGSASNTVELGVAYGPTPAAYNTPESLVTMTVGAGAPSNLYIGVLEDQNLDSPSQITISDSNGGTATANPQIYFPTTLSGGQNTWYFFDVSGAQAGDVLTLSVAQYNTGASYADHGTVSGLTFDSVNPLATTPEPATLGLFAIGGMSLMLFRRKVARRA